MKPIKPLAVFAIVAFATTLTTCQKEGPMERAGKKVDNAVEKTGDKIQDATNNKK